MRARNQFFPLFFHELRLVSAMSLPVLFALSAYAWLLRTNTLGGYEGESVAMIIQELTLLLSIFLAESLIFGAGFLYPKAAKPSYEYFFSRAIDRRVYFLSKWTTFLILAVSPAIVMLLSAILWSPDLLLDSRTIPIPIRPAVNQTIQMLTDQTSFSSEHEIRLVNGKVLYSTWKICSSFALAALIRCGSTLLAKYGRNRVGTLGVSLALAATMWLTMLLSNQWLFIHALAHPLIALALVVALVLSTQNFCERQFRSLEIK